MRVPQFQILVLALGLLPSLASAEALPCRQDASAGDRPRIGLVLGGGGARGFAHVSVLKELERLHVPVDCIAGTSAGSMVGGLYASGLTAAQLETLVTSVDWKKALDDSLARPERSFRRKRDDDLSLIPAKPGVTSKGVRLSPGLLAGENIQLMLERMTQPVARINDFNRLPIPYRAVATDANTGDAVLLDHGNLANAMRASMSIPAAFRPVVIDGKVLVDGGVANQLPVDVVRAMGADIVIAVDVGTPLSQMDEGASLLAFANQMSGFLTVKNTNASIATLGPRDILIQPQFGDEVSTTDFGKVSESLAIGDTAAAQASSKLAALSRPQADYQLKLTAQTKRDTSPPVIDFVRLDNKTAYSDELLMARLDVPLGQPLDVIRLEDSILHVYGLQTLDKITYSLVEQDGRSGLLVHVEPHSYGPNYLETGLNFYSSFSGDFLINLRAGLLRSPLNALGGEARVLAQFGGEPGLLAEIYQPLDVKGRYFVGGRMSYANPQLAQFDSDGNRLAVFSVPIFGADIYAGREFSNYGAATVAYRRAKGSTDLVTGDTSMPESDFQIGEARWNVTLDRLDSAYVPREGSYVSLGGLYSREGLGADSDFDQLNLDASYARLFGIHSGFVGMRYHETTKGEAPFQSQFRLGGVTRFAGYRPNELVTPNYALVYGGYTLELGSVLGRPAILGGTVEYGQVWQNGSAPANRREELDGSVYLGFDSWLGRLLFGYGAREGGEGTFFLELGQTR